MNINLDSKALKLRENADTEYETADIMYEDYGAHIATEDGDIELQAVHFDWLDEDNDSIVERLLQLHEITASDARKLVELARQVREALEEIEKALAFAVEAYIAGDLRGTITRLQKAAALEREHMDCPATRSLTNRLLRDPQQ